MNQNIHQAIASILHSHFTQAGANPQAKSSSLTVARWRAAHQLLDQPQVFTDPLVLALLGPDQRHIREQLPLHQHPLSAAMRIAIAVRSRYSEDEREQAYVAGAKQYVILGAGLDSYGLRSTHAEEQVFEVDLAATQQQKIARVAQLKQQPICELKYVACDFERGALANCLVAAGFNINQQAFFSWLGVVPYLDQHAIAATLQFVASCAPGTTLVFDYMLETAELNAMEAMVADLFAQQLASIGEPIKSYFSPPEFAAMLTQLGFSKVEAITADYLNQRYLANRDDGLRVGNLTQMFKVTV